jgi:hypothetical protein
MLLSICDVPLQAFDYALTIHCFIPVATRTCFAEIWSQLLALIAILLVCYFKADFKDFQ